MQYITLIYYTNDVLMDLLMYYITYKYTVSKQIGHNGDDIYVCP